MADNLSPLEKNEEQLLQSALSTAFTPAPTFPQSQPESALEAPDPTPSPLYAEEPIASSSDSLDDSWHTEYESHVQSWRAQSAEAREKAEKERAKWEEIRSQEHVGDVVQVEEITSGIPAVGEAEPSPADARDLVTGEHEKPPAHTRHDTGDDSKASSQKWSDVPSDLASSYPSMSFPSPSRPTSPTHSHSHRPHRPPATHSKTPLTTQESVPLPPSTTLAIFDSSLPTKTRLGALVSSLAINCLIPFVNGVMLGFGEIFAKNFIVGWLGWKLPGSSVANVGVKSQSAGRR